VSVALSIQSYCTVFADNFSCKLFNPDVSSWFLLLPSGGAPFQPQLRSTLKVLVYAPNTKSGESQMASILQSLHLPYHKMDVDPSNARQSDHTINHNNEERADSFDANGWVLLPMKSSAPIGSNASKSDLTSSSLGEKLEDALERTRILIEMKKTCNNSNKNEAVLFLGMDSPELPMEEIVYGLQISSGNRRLLQRSNEGTNENAANYQDNARETFTGKAHLCPANDGGYGLLSVPKHAPSSTIFSCVRWSHSLTAVSQLKALTDAKVDVSIGNLMHDVDEPADVQELAIRLAHSRNDENRNTNSCSENKAEGLLTNLSSGISTIVSSDETKSFPHHTWKRLVDLNVINGE